MLNSICSISIAKSNTKESNDKTHFEVLRELSFHVIAQLIVNRTWSPHVWQHGYRASKNWQSANFIALDFDSGFPLTETIKICEDENLTFLIGTTKSHQVEKISPAGKISPPVDRYRLCIATDGPMTSAETYRNTLDYFSLFFPIDESCKDLARYFFPCTEITTICSGRLQPWLPVTDEEKARRVRLQKAYQLRLLEHRESGIIPSWILFALKQEHPIGTRHKTCYRLGAEMAKLGFEESYIEKLVMESTLNAIGGDDVRRAVRNGIRAARNFWKEET